MKRASLGLLAVMGCLALSAIPASAQASGFDCGHAGTPAEHAICANPDLATADAKMSAAYKLAQAVIDADQAVLKDEQLAWLKDRDERCEPDPTANPAQDPAFVTCLASAYDQRITQLTAGIDGRSACGAIAAALHSEGNLSGLKDHSIAEIVAAMPGSALRLGASAGGGYVVKSTYAGSLSCQEPHLFQTGAGGLAEVPVPSDFAPEEGAHCGEDRVELASINGIAGLLHQFGKSGQSIRIGLSLRVNDAWTDECWIRVETKAAYEVAVASCPGNDCGPLADLAARYATANHGQLKGKSLPSTDALPPDQQAKFAGLLRLAEAGNLSTSFDVPFFGDDTHRAEQVATSGCDISFDGTGSRLFPVVAGGEILLGKIGHDGFGLGVHSGGPNDAIAIYRSGDGKLEPVAGFCVAAGHRSITAIDVR